MINKNKKKEKREREREREENERDFAIKRWLIICIVGFLITAKIPKQSNLQLSVPRFVQTNTVILYSLSLYSLFSTMIGANSLSLVVGRPFQECPQLVVEKTLLQRPRLSLENFASSQADCQPCLRPTYCLNSQAFWPKHGVRRSQL